MSSILKDELVSKAEPYSSLFEKFDEGNAGRLLDEYVVVFFDNLDSPERLEEFDELDSDTAFKAENYGWVSDWNHFNNCLIISKEDYYDVLNPKPIHKDPYESTWSDANEAVKRTVSSLNKLSDKIESKTMENENMSVLKRRTVTISLIDPDNGLEPEHALVARYENIITEDDDATTIQELCINKGIAQKLRTHNELRATQVNKDIQNRTGNSVMLLPVKLKDLEWEIK